MSWTIVIREYTQIRLRDFGRHDTQLGPGPGLGLGIEEMVRFAKRFLHDLVEYS